VGHRVGSAFGALSLWGVGASLALLLVNACAFDTTGLLQCRSNSECASGLCVERLCVAGPVDPGPDPDVTADAPDLVDTTDTADEPDLPGDPDLADVPDTGCLSDHCDGSVAVTCTEDGGEVRVDCATAAACPGELFGCRCEAAECVPRVCVPNALFCDENDRVQCNADGSDFGFVETCGELETCVGGTCVDSSCDVGFTDCVNGVLLECSAEGTIVVGPDCQLTGMRCDAELVTCRCGAGLSCEDDELCTDPDDGVCECQGVVCDEGEHCDGANGCRCGASGLDCAPGSTCVAGVCVCEPGRFGPDCTGVCACVNGTCNDGAAGNGACACPSGFFGSTCAGVCACVNGTCNDGAAGTGACTCPSGFFGSTCAGVCACVNGTCSDGATGTGACSCPSGFFGSTCAGVCACVNGTCSDGATGTGACTCPSGFFGSTCAGVCDCQNGATCADGAAGNGLCTCADGYYGTNCAGECACENGTCHQGATGTGVCTCDPGYYQPDCDRACECVNGTCDDGATGTGTCTCPQDYFGTHCEEQCECQNDAICNSGATGDGTCTCVGDFYGPTCASACECQNDATCNAGSAGDGTCTCVAGFYGPTCAGVCDCGTGTCDQGATGTGACTCPAGFFGEDCSGVCDCTDEQVCADGADGTGACQDPIPLFRVQRGETDVIGTATLTLSAENGDFIAPTGPAFVRIVNTRLTGMGKISGGGGQQPSRSMVWISGVPSDTSAFTLNRSVSNDDSRVMWEIVEYIGPADGPNAIAVRAQASLQNNSAQPASGAEIVGVVDDADVMVIITGQQVSTNTQGDYNRGLNTAAWDPVTQRPVFTRNESGNTTNISYAVIEFTGSNWTVQRIEYNHQTASAVETQSVPGLTDISRAFIHAQFRSTLPQVDEWGAEAWLSDEFDPPSLALRLEPGASVIPDPGQTMQTVAWVVINSASGLRGLEVNHYNGTRTGPQSEADCWTEVTVPAVRSLDTASIWGETARTSGQNNATPRGSISLRMTDVDAVRLCQSDADDTRSYRYSIVRWPFE
jgi:hypothetical protein